jgi:hypothetical protein
MARRGLARLSRCHSCTRTLFSLIYFSFVVK